MIKDYYCQQKFDHLTIRLYDGTVASCCQAQYHSLPVSVIREHGIFNYPSIQDDRMKMLLNRRVEDCESCWIPESKGLVSRRQQFNTTERIYHTIEIDKPKIINIIVSNTCNQTCVYCCKNFSHSWLNDVIENGPYPTVDDDDRFKITNMDRVVHKLSQKQLAQTSMQKEILEQISRCVEGTEFFITGGEPLLYNDLVNLISRISTAKQIFISTGLHVDPKRFRRVCQDLHQICPGIRFVISAENIGNRQEFVRYGSQWPIFLQNLSTVQSLFDIEFRATISNLTIFGLTEFLNFFNDQKIILVPVKDPTYLRPGVMDPESKQELAATLQGKHPDMMDIIDHVMDDSDLSERENLKVYVSEFARRRNLKIDIFPTSFLDWLGLS